MKKDSPLEGSTVLVGVCGGIAAYKSAQLVRCLRKEEARVRVVMTRSAQAFVGPLTFEALSEEPVFLDMFELGGDAGIRHIAWAQEADAAVIAPATANMVAKLANGLADDALSTLMLAMTTPVLVCPAMNSRMYENRVVQANLRRLCDLGFHVLAPDCGALACGTFGPGRLPDPEIVVDRLKRILLPKDFEDTRVLVTAGPTREPIDPVRFISNPSTGKMGYAVAQAAEHRGARVVLVCGPTALPDPVNVEVVRVTTALEMAEAVYAHAEEAQVVVKTAAVADYRPEAPEKLKIKKTEGPRTLSLTRNPDILRELGSRKQRGQVLVGFAAETHDLDVYAVTKLQEKNLDMIVANLIGARDSGFAAETNRVKVFFRDGTQEVFPVMAKKAVAHLLLDRVHAALYAGRGAP